MHNRILNLIYALKEEQNAGLTDPLFISIENTFQEIDLFLSDNYVVEGVGTALGVGAVASAAGAFAARTAAENQLKTNLFTGTPMQAIRAISNARDLESLAQALGLSAVLMSVAGISYGIYKLTAYIRRSKQVIKKYESDTSSVKDPRVKSAINEKIQTAKDKLELAQEKVRKEKAKEIQKTQDLKNKLVQLKNSKSPNKQEIDKLQKKIDARMEVMNKLNSIVK